MSEISILREWVVPAVVTSSLQPLREKAAEGDFNIRDIIVKIADNEWCRRVDPTAAASFSKSGCREEVTTAGTNHH